jgi:predicted ATPase
MQKIVIKNFGPIEDADIDIKKILVLIGEQASGKSTIAKLIYFFQSLRDDLFKQIFDAQTEKFSPLTDLIYLIRNKFYDFFGSTLHLSDFTITYYFNDTKSIALSLDNRKKLHINDKKFLNRDFETSANQIKKILFNGLTSNNISEQLAFEQSKLKYAQRLSKLVNELFECDYNNSLYVIDGRNTTISYSSLFENYFFSDLQDKILRQSQLDENGKFNKKTDEQTANETLMLKFIERTLKLKDTFKKFGNFEGLIDSYADSKDDTRNLTKIKNKIEEIIKGRYVIDNWGEKIITNNETGDYVFLSNASSGQKESIRILQDIFMVVLENSKALRIIEEPEAHLFPVAQKHIIELLALMVKQNEYNQLIITTHSPYILSVFNNLLFAERVVAKNKTLEKEVAAVIDKDLWLNAADFAAYSLNNRAMGSEQKYCESIVNTDSGLIAQNYLDTVSEMLGGEFNKLYSIHAKTFARK